MSGLYEDEPFPWSHQGEAVGLLLRGSGALWMDPRTGKTRPALEACRIWEGMGGIDRGCFVGSVNALEVWRRHLATYMPHWPVEVVRGMQPHPLARSTRAVIANPDIIRGQRSNTPGRLNRGWLRTIAEWMGGGAVLVLDECHKYATNPMTQEYKAIQQLARCARVVWQLTGTYYEHSALDAHHQLQLLGARYPMAWWTDKSFGDKFCERKPNPFKGPKRVGYRRDGTTYAYRAGGYDYSGIKDGAEVELMDALSGVVLRRRRDECLDIPNTRIMPYWVDHHDQQVSLRRDEMESLRSELVLLKAQRTLEYVEELRERPVVVYGWHRKLLTHLANHFRAPLIFGDTSQRQRVEVEREFQAGKHPVLCATIELDAIDLSRADHAVYAEIDWSATRMRQSMDRIVNGNKPNETVAHMLLVSGSVEETVWDRILMKGEAIERLDKAAHRLRELGLSFAELA